MEQEGGFLDPSIEEEAEKFEAKSGGTDLREKFQKLMKDATFVLGILQFLNANPSKVEASAYLEKVKGDPMRTATYYLCTESMPQSYVESYRPEYKINRNDILGEKVFDWCKAKDTRSLYVDKFRAYEKPVWGDERDDPNQIFDLCQQANFKELEELEKKYHINLETIKNIENDFVAGLKEGSFIKPKYTQLNKKEHVSQMSANDVIMDVEYMVDSLPDGDKIPWEVKDGFIEDITQYVIMDASKMASWIK